MQISLVLFQYAPKDEKHHSKQEFRRPALKPLEGCRFIRATGIFRHIKNQPSLKMISTRLLAFANLLETANLCALGDTYEEQGELVSICIAEGRSFAASLPVRHRIRGSQCSVDADEFELHFEDPKQQVEIAVAHENWWQPAGRFFATDFSEPHPTLKRSKKLPDEFSTMLESARP